MPRTCPESPSLAPAPTSDDGEEMWGEGMGNFNGIFKHPHAAGLEPFNANRRDWLWEDQDDGGGRAAGRKRKGGAEEDGEGGSGGARRRTETTRMEGEAEAGGAGGAGREAEMEHSTGEAADAANSSDDAFKQTAQKLWEQVLSHHTGKERSQVVSDSRYRSILFSLLPQLRVTVPSQDLRDFPLSDNDRKNACAKSAKDLTAAKDATGYEYNGERYVVRSQKKGGKILLPSSMTFEVLFKMLIGDARTEQKLRKKFRNFRYLQTSLPGVVIDDFMRVMRMCYQMHTRQPPPEMKCSNYFHSQGDRDFLAKFSKLKLAGVNMGADDAVRLATILSSNREHLGKLQSSTCRAI